MKLPSDPTKYTSQFKYVEIGHYVKSLNQVIREKYGPKENRKPLLIDISEVESYADRQNRTGVYTSIFQYNSTDFDTATCLGSLCFDFDSDDLEYALGETNRLVEYLVSHLPSDSVGVYFSGGKGFHIECEAIALGISPSNDLARVYRFIADDLKKNFSLNSLDTAIYDDRRMWRLVNTRHQRRGLFKVECMQLLSRGMGAIEDWAKQPRPFEIVEQVSDSNATQWYKDYEGRFDESEEARKQAILNWFLKNGVSTTYHTDKQKMEFDIRNAPEGTRNNTFNQKIYLYVRNNPSMSVFAVEAYFTPLALDIGLGGHEIAATIKSAYRAAKRDL